MPNKRKQEKKQEIVVVVVFDVNYIEYPVTIKDRTGLKISKGCRTYTHLKV